jgi:hypothetical protein
MKNAENDSYFSRHWIENMQKQITFTNSFSIVAVFENLSVFSYFLVC